MIFSQIQINASLDSSMPDGIHRKKTTEDTSKMANLIIQSRILRQRNPLEQLLWRIPVNSSDASLRCGERRFLRFVGVLPPHHPHLLFHSLSLCNCPVLSPIPVLPIRRRHLLPHFFPVTASMSSGATAESKTVRLVVKGRVQGVFYRNWTIDNAKELGLKGWVRNCRDGSVEALFSGSPQKVEEMEQRCRRGPPDAMVTGLHVYPSTDDPGTSFERKPTA